LNTLCQLPRRACPRGGASSSGRSPGRCVESCTAEIVNNSIPQSVNDTAKKLKDFAFSTDIVYIQAGADDQLVQEEIWYLLSSAGYNGLNTNELAYVLTTAHIETKWKNYEEQFAGGDERAYFNNLYNGILGNELGSDDGYTYRGRGLIHLTGKANYQKVAGRFPEINLMYAPVRASYGSAANCYIGSSPCRTEIAVVSMKEGLLTDSAENLSKYNIGCDYNFRDARNIINKNPENIEGRPLRPIAEKLASEYAKILSAQCKLGGLTNGTICH
jgi:hypothetical protein